MWTSYSTKDAANLVGLSESIIRSCVREGLLSSQADQLPLRFSFEDLAVLRTLKNLVSSGVSVRRARRQLSAIKYRCCENNSLASLCLESHDGQVVIRENEQAWQADSGQLVFDFQFQRQESELWQLHHTSPIQDLDFIPNQSADQWFDQALDLEEESPELAVQAYEQVLKQRPDCTESLVNLGRLHAEADKFDEASHCFNDALNIDPRESTALYNLGVIAQDTGYDQEAIQYYEAALSYDRRLAEAHYNLATIFDKTGDARQAIRHINEFRKLSKRQ